MRTFLSHGMTHTSEGGPPLGCRPPLPLAHLFLQQQLVQAPVMVDLAPHLGCSKNTNSMMVCFKSEIDERQSEMSCRLQSDYTKQRTLPAAMSWHL